MVVSRERHDCNTSENTASDRDPACVVGYESVASPEFQAKIAAVVCGKTEYTEVLFNQPANWSFLPASDRTERTRRAFGSLAGRWLLPHSQDQESWSTVGDAPLELAIGLHGFGCAHMTEGKQQYNYFRALTAALDIPVYSFDWAGYNTKPDEQALFAKQEWLTSIDHNPYILLQLLDSLVENIASKLQGTSTAPLHLNLIGHSVGARSLLVAASINHGQTLKAIEEKWQTRLGRAVQFQLTILEPAFGIQNDHRINALRWADIWLLRQCMPYIPHTVMTVIQAALSTQSASYGVENSPIYPFSYLLQREHLPFLVGHPAAIRRPPTTTILTPSQLREIGYSVAAVLAQQDRLVDNVATQKILTGADNEGREEWEHYRAELDPTTISIYPTRSEDKNSIGVASLNTGHTPEISHPDAIARIIRFLHEQQ